LYNAGEPLISDGGEADVPLLPNVPLAGLSNQRGNKAERVQVITWPGIPTGEGPIGNYVVQVSGFNGAFGPETYAVRYTVTPPLGDTSGTPRAAGFHPVNPVPAGAPLAPLTDTDPSPTSLILTNPTRLNHVYGATRAGVVGSSVSTLAGATNGTVFRVDTVPEVIAAYAEWDLAPWDPDEANKVVRAINDAVDTYLNTHRSALTSLTIVGSDEIIPMGRLQDLTQTANERSFAQELRTSAADTGGTNALYGAALAGRILSDDPFGSFAPRGFGGAWLYIPDVALGRLVETPEQIQKAVQQFMSPTADPAHPEIADPPGTLRPSSTLSSGYDFMTLLGQTIKSAFHAQLPGATDVDPTSSLIGDDWNRSALSNKVVNGGNSASLISINAHYSPQALSPAKRFDPAFPEAPDLSAAQLTSDAALSRRVLLTMGCHSGFNIANFLSTGDADQDFPELLADEPVSAFIGNTGYGIGVRHVNAFSQTLFNDFAARVGQFSLGGALQQAKQEYLANGITNVYDYKVLAEATYFGIPQYTIAGASAPPAPPAIDPPNPTAINGGLYTASLTVAQPTSTGGPWVPHTSDDGQHWTLPGDKLAIAQHRPVQPKVDTDVTAEGRTASGVLVTGLKIGDEDSGFNPLLARPVIDLASHEPEINFGELAGPAQMADVTNFNGPDGPRQRAVTIPAQFFSDGFDEDGQLIGIERRYSEVREQIVYRPEPADPGYDPDVAADTTGPELSNAVALQDGGQTIFTVNASDPESNVIRVFVLYRTGNDAEFHRLELTQADPEDHTLWGATENIGGDIDFIVQALTDAGLTKASLNKARFFNETIIENPGDETVTVTPSRPPDSDGYYTSDLTVHLESSLAGAPPITVELDGEPGQTYPNNDVPISGDGDHTLVYTTAFGTTNSGAPLHYKIDAPVMALNTPAANDVFVLRQHAAVDYDCIGAFLTCSSTVPQGAQLDTATVTDGVNHRSVTLTGDDPLNLTSPITHTYDVRYLPEKVTTAAPDCDNGAGHKIQGAANGAFTVGRLVQIDIRFRVCDVDGNSVVSPEPAPPLGPPQEVNASGQPMGVAFGGCPPLLGLLPVCVAPILPNGALLNLAPPVPPVIPPRDTNFRASGDGWLFRQDTTFLSPGLHYFRVLLRDGTHIDYRVNKATALR
jgi:hypothetical protein